MMVLAFPSAFLGSTLLTYVSNDFMKPLLLVVLSLLVIYTYAQKNFGQQVVKNDSAQILGFLCCTHQFCGGFTDGFIGRNRKFLVVALHCLDGL